MWSNLSGYTVQWAAVITNLVATREAPHMPIFLLPWSCSVLSYILESQGYFFVWKGRKTIRKCAKKFKIKQSIFYVLVSVDCWRICTQLIGYNSVDANAQWSNFGVHKDITSTVFELQIWFLHQNEVEFCKKCNATDKSD